MRLRPTPTALYLLLALNVALTAVVCLHDRIYLLALNARHGCYPWSPAVVPHRDGMNLCPGQSTFVHLPHSEGD